MSWSTVEVDPVALRHNLAALRLLLPANTSMVAVVKSNAYGHGLAQVAHALRGHADAYHVDSVGEAAIVRNVAPEARILLLASVVPEERAIAVELGCEVAVMTPASAADYSALGADGSPVPVHVKLDAGFGRFGFLPNDDPAGLLRGLPGIRVAGVYAHLSDTGTDYSASQALRFAEAANAFPGVPRHLTASGGIIEGTLPQGGLARAGIALYGLPPLPTDAPLRPALRWSTRVAQVKVLPGGHPVGYGRTYTTRQAERIALLPVGYADGYPRSLSGRGTVLIGGRRLPVRGRISMNSIAVGNVPADVREGDEAVLIGRQGTDGLGTEEVARTAGTISYELLARISPLLPRTFAG